MSTSNTPPQHTNRLAQESSPYLLQHAHNPVDWYPWGPEALALAREKKRPILVSIGYSACHWCHVMERESFEHPAIAKLMNEYFVCIKVDREERPDVDQVYMEAVQAMGLQGGWPLNVFSYIRTKALLWGHLLPPANWAQVLKGVMAAFRDPEQRQKLEASAEGFADHIRQTDTEKFGLDSTAKSFQIEQLQGLYTQLAQRFDHELGGTNRAPKFPMPNLWLSLTRYAQLTGNNDALGQVTRTLDAMAYGGIYDQAGGGMARYSTDAQWLVPHFEKCCMITASCSHSSVKGMPSPGTNATKSWFTQTVEWLEREMLNPRRILFSPGC